MFLFRQAFPWDPAESNAKPIRLALGNVETAIAMFGLQLMELR